MQGFTDGISSRFLRSNRSMLVMGSLKQNNVERAEALAGRLEEILIFEISKDGYVRVGYIDRRLYVGVWCEFSSTNNVCSRYFPCL
jgi:hypothetical protein